MYVKGAFEISLIILFTLLNSSLSKFWQSWELLMLSIKMSITFAITSLEFLSYKSTGDVYVCQESSYFLMFFCFDQLQWRWYVVFIHLVHFWSLFLTIVLSCIMLDLELYIGFWFIQETLTKENFNISCYLFHTLISFIKRNLNTCWITPNWKKNILVPFL